MGKCLPRFIFDDVSCGGVNCGLQPTIYTTSQDTIHFFLFEFHDEGGDWRKAILPKVGFETLVGRSQTGQLPGSMMNLPDGRSV